MESKHYFFEYLGVYIMLKAWHKLNNQWFVDTDLQGESLLHDPMLNKGCAFTQEERDFLGLTGLLPDCVESLESQVQRAYQQFTQQVSEFEKNLYLQSLHQINQTLCYKLISEHLPEMLPIMYTPIVGLAVENFSVNYTRPYGLYVSYPQRHKMASLFSNITSNDVLLSVVTDGEGVLGIGDQGMGGMHIAIAKLMVYTVCGGIPPHVTLPICLDVGTNNEELLNNPMYLGWRHPRIEGQDYDDFIAEFVYHYKNKFPHSLLHWEDLGRNNASRILYNYRNQLCTINGDIQTTGSVTLACILSAVQKSKIPLSQHKIVIFGAGSAGTGIAKQLCDAMLQAGLTKSQAYSQIWLIDQHGLLTNVYPNLLNFQYEYVHDIGEFHSWTRNSPDIVSLYDVILNVKPTILIGCSTVYGAFNESIVKLMAQNTPHPIIMPLSNPLHKSEACPNDLLTWTNGQAIVATGSPYKPVLCNNVMREIAQCNNALSFPGIGLGVLAVRAKAVSDGMLRAASQALADYSYTPKFTDPVLTGISDSKNLRFHIAAVVAQQAREEGLATVGDHCDVNDLINNLIWDPEYYQFK